MAMKALRLSVVLFGLALPNAVQDAFAQGSQSLPELDAQFRSLYQQRKYEEAIPIAKRALQTREQASGSEHPLTVTDRKSVV